MFTPKITLEHNLPFSFEDNNGSAHTLNRRRKDNTDLNTQGEQVNETQVKPIRARQPITGRGDESWGEHSGESDLSFTCRFTQSCSEGNRSDKSLDRQNEVLEGIRWQHVSCDEVGPMSPFHPDAQIVRRIVQAGSLCPSRAALHLRSCLYKEKEPIISY